MSLDTEVLTILIEARNEAAATLAEMNGELDAVGAHANNMGAGLHTLGLGMIAAGAVAVAGLVEATKQASDYNTMLVHIQANTGLTDAQTQQMSAGIQAMAAKTGAPLDQLAEGFMHIHNFGFDAADAMKILQPAMESALSTGDSVATVASTLGVALHEFHLGADQAAQAMNVLHLAAQEGNATLGQFVDGTTQAFNMAGAYKVQLTDVAAALSTLTQSGQTARAASQGLSSTFQGIVKPTATSANFIAVLSHATGVDLVSDFSAAGLASRGFTNIMGDVQLALQKSAGNTSLQSAALAAYSENLKANHVSQSTYNADMAKMALALKDPAQATNALFANVRAAREVMLLTGSQYLAVQSKHKSRRSWMRLDVGGNALVHQTCISCNYGSIELLLIFPRTTYFRTERATSERNEILLIVQRTKQTKPLSSNPNRIPWFRVREDVWWRGPNLPFTVCSGYGRWR